MPELVVPDCHVPALCVHHPFKKPHGNSHLRRHAATQTDNALLRGVRALGERAAAELEERLCALSRITLSPSRIGDIVRAALVLNRLWK
ncbi:MAG: hypothetical protein HY241_09505 [Actinobacteria bacterium]|nr:hypothetical protein [Actinomycetota bacterium]